MDLCFIDESGDMATLDSPTSPIQPLLVVGAIAVPGSEIGRLTRRLLTLKHEFFPGLLGSGGRRLDAILVEIKGAEVRKALRSSSRRERRHAFGFLDAVLDALEARGAKVFGRIWIKEPGQAMKGRSVYAASVQAICSYFNNLLELQQGDGIVIADSRTHGLDVNVCHSVFTQMYQRGRARHSRLVCPPTLGKSDNHAGLQLADLLCSALLFPMASFAYCHGRIRSVHVSHRYEAVQSRYGERLRRLRHAWRDESGKLCGGIVVSDPLGRKPSSALFG